MLKSVKENLFISSEEYCGPLSVMRVAGIPCLENMALR